MWIAGGLLIFIAFMCTAAAWAAAEWTAPSASSGERAHDCD